MIGWRRELEDFDIVGEIANLESVAIAMQRFE
jgi:hypothetical protein